MIDEMKPWYDNYCFSEDALHTQSKVFNSDMVIYYLRNYIDRGESPKQMIFIRINLPCRCFVIVLATPRWIPPLP